MKDVKSTLSLEDGVLISDGKNLIKIDIEKLDYKNDKIGLCQKIFILSIRFTEDSLTLMSTLTFPYNRNYLKLNSDTPTLSIHLRMFLVMIYIKKMEKSGLMNTIHFSTPTNYQYGVLT